jgi:hypothetical protein
MPILNEYISLILKLKENGYLIKKISDYFFIKNNASPIVYLRHDVDRMPGRAVEMARQESENNFLSTYYFRCDKNRNFPLEAIGKIDKKEHEIGFHYESFSRCKGENLNALQLFRNELEELRKIANIRTIAAHGAPLSKWSNMNFGSGNQGLFKELEIIGDARENIDFSNILYVSDTGGNFGSEHNLRDKVEGLNLKRKYTIKELIDLLKPDKYPFLVINTHPERWSNSFFGKKQIKVTDFMINQLKKNKF